MKTILIIEDDDAFHFLCEMAFRRSGRQIKLLKALDGVEALEILEAAETGPDLILVDINMPRMNGLEFLAQYAQRGGGQIPVVAMLTSSDQARDRQQAMSYEFVRDYLIKPLTHENIERLEAIFEDLVAAS